VFVVHCFVYWSAEVLYWAAPIVVPHAPLLVEYSAENHSNPRVAMVKSGAVAV
jgi:hypothetical protein